MSERLSVMVVSAIWLSTISAGAAEPQPVFKVQAASARAHVVAAGKTAAAPAQPALAPAKSGGAPAASAPAPATTSTTMAMQGGLTFVFQLPSSFKLRRRTKAGAGCDAMIWMKPDTISEDDGPVCEVAVVNPSEEVEKDVQSESQAQLAQDLLSGKAKQWREFHHSQPKDVTIKNLKYVQIDFDGTRIEGAPRIQGFQLLTIYKDKLVTIIAQTPEQASVELKNLSDLMQSLQVQ